MTIILVLLLILTVAGLLYFAFQLLSSRKKSSELETELRNQKTKYDFRS